MKPILKLTRIFAASLLVLAVGALGGCKKKETTSTTTTPAPAPAPNPQTAPPPVPGVMLSEVRLGNAIGADKTVTAAGETFSPKDTIYVSVTTTGTAVATPIRALWTFQDGQVVNDDSQTIVPTGADTTEFHIAKPDGFPAGSYKVEIFVDAKSVATRSFTVK